MQSSFLLHLTNHGIRKGFSRLYMTSGEGDARPVPIFRSITTTRLPSQIMHIFVNSTVSVLAIMLKLLPQKAKRIYHILRPEHFYRHSMHGFCVDTVMPDKTAQDLTQRPILTIAAFSDGILQKIRVRFQRLKSAFAARIDASVIVGINMNLRK